MAAVKFVSWVLCFPCFKYLSLAASSTIIACCPLHCCASYVFETKASGGGGSGAAVPACPCLRWGISARAPVCPTVCSWRAIRYGRFAVLQALSFLVTVDTLPHQICQSTACAYAVNLVCVLCRGRMLWLLIPTTGRRDTHTYSHVNMHWPSLAPTCCVTVWF